MLLGKWRPMNNPRREAINEDVSIKTVTEYGDRALQVV
jgi:hypothetical protein